MIALLMALFSGCKEHYPTISTRQALVFQVDYINYTRGYQHNGFLIDNEGNVYTYNNPEKWNFPDKDLNISEPKVVENIGYCTKYSCKIPREELQKYSFHIRNISSSKVTAIKNISADAGSLQYICYYYSESSGNYKGSIIKMEGDYTCENLNFYSKKVSLWLKDIHNRIEHR